METVLYADVLFLINFSMDYLSLYAVSRLLALPSRAWRMLAGAGVGGVYGVLSVVLCAKGKLANYFIGFIQNFTYTILAFQNQFYGEVIEQGFYIITMIWGIFVWKEFRGAPRTVGWLLALMFIFFISGLGAIIISGAN